MVTKRIDIIFEHVVNDTEQKLKLNNLSDIGIDALTVSLDLGYQRTNVSKELNQLWQEGHLIKISGRPILFIAYKPINARFPNLYIPSFIPTNDSIRHYLFSEKEYSQQSPFESLSEEMKTAVSAMTYPPSGLPLLIYGKEGVQKLTFAQSIISYCKEKQIIPRNARIQIIDCQDSSQYITFSNNPKFGSLFVLRNVEFLSSSHFDQLISLIEYFTSPELNSSTNKHYPLIILTSADSKDDLFSKLTQVIPLKINLKSFEELLPVEKMSIVLDAFKHEATSLNKNIVMDTTIFNLFCSHHYLFNYASLRSEVKNALATSYLRANISNENIIRITLDDIFGLSSIQNDNDSAPFDYSLFFSNITDQNVYIYSNRTTNLDNLIENYIDELEYAVKLFSRTFKTNSSNLEYDIKELSELYTSFSPHNKLSKLHDRHIANIQKLKELFLSLPNPDSYPIDDVSLFIFYCFVLMINQGIVEQGSKHTNSLLLDKLVQSKLINTSMCNEKSSNILESVIVHLSILEKRKTVQLLVLIDNRIQKNIYEPILSNSQKVKYHVDYIDAKQNILEVKRHIDDLFTKKLSINDTLIVTDVYHIFRNRDTLKSSLNTNVEFVYPLSLPLLDKCISNISIGNPLSNFKDINIQRISDEPIVKQIDLDEQRFIDKLNDTLLVSDLNFLDSRKSTPLLIQALNTITEQFKISKSKEFIVKYLIHSSFMLERVIKNEFLTHPFLQNYYSKNAYVMSSVKQSFKIVEEAYGITIPPTEIAYIADILLEFINL